MCYEANTARHSILTMSGHKDGQISCNFIIFSKGDLFNVFLSVI